MLLSKIVEMTNRMIIKIKLMTAVIAPIIDSQFFVDCGNFMFVRFIAFYADKSKKIILY